MDGAEYYSRHQESIIRDHWRPHFEIDLRRGGTAKHAIRGFVS